MGRILLEVCCGSADDVIEAHRGGADRVELNCDLFHGGLTPTLGSLLVAKRETGMKIIAMVRPREGGFCYTQAEFAAAVEDGPFLYTAADQAAGKRFPLSGRQLVPDRKIL